MELSSKEWAKTASISFVNCDSQTLVNLFDFDRTKVNFSGDVF